MGGATAAWPREFPPSAKRVGADGPTSRPRSAVELTCRWKMGGNWKLQVASPHADERPLEVVAVTNRERTGIRAAAGNSPPAATPAELSGRAQKGCGAAPGSARVAWTESISYLTGRAGSRSSRGVRHPDRERLQPFGESAGALRRFRGHTRFRLEYALRPPREAPSGLRLAPAGPHVIAALGEMGERRRGARG
jgi:hypothetical protein